MLYQAKIVIKWEDFSSSNWKSWTYILISNQSDFDKRPWILYVYCSFCIYIFTYFVYIWLETLKKNISEMENQIGTKWNPFINEVKLQGYGTDDENCLFYDDFRWNSGWNLPHPIPWMVQHPLGTFRRLQLLVSFFFSRWISIDSII